MARQAPVNDIASLPLDLLQRLLSLRQSLQDAQAGFDRILVDYHALRSDFSAKSLDLERFVDFNGSSVSSETFRRYNRAIPHINALEVSPWKAQLQELMTVFGPAILDSVRVFESLAWFCKQATNPKLPGHKAISKEDALEAIKSAQTIRSAKPRNTRTDLKPRDIKDAMIHFELAPNPPEKKKVLLSINAGPPDENPSPQQQDYEQDGQSPQPSGSPEKGLDGNQQQSADSSGANELEKISWQPAESTGDDFGQLENVTTRKRPRISTEPQQLLARKKPRMRQLLSPVPEDTEIASSPPQIMAGQDAEEVDLSIEMGRHGKEQALPDEPSIPYNLCESSDAFDDYGSNDFGDMGGNSDLSSDDDEDTANHHVIADYENDSEDEDPDDIELSNEVAMEPFAKNFHSDRKFSFETEDGSSIFQLCANTPESIVGHDAPQVETTPSAKSQTLHDLQTTNLHPATDVTSSPYRSRIRQVKMDGNQPDDDNHGRATQIIDKSTATPSLLTAVLVEKEKPITSAELAPSDLASAKQSTSLCTCFAKDTIMYTQDYVSRFNSSNWLNQDCIIEVLKKVCLPSQRCVDFGKLEPGRDWSAWAASRVHKTTSQYHQVFVPVCSSSHWFLLVFNLESQIVEYYNSLPHTDSVNVVPMVKAMRQVILSKKTEQEQEQEQWKLVSPADAPRQTNMDDCGIHVILSALHIIARRPFPTHYDTALWRLLLSYFLEPDDKAHHRLLTESERIDPTSLHGARDLISVLITSHVQTRNLLARDEEPLRKKKDAHEKSLSLLGELWSDRDSTDMQAKKAIVDSISKVCHDLDRLPLDRKHCEQAECALMILFNAILDMILVHEKETRRILANHHTTCSF